MKILLLLLVFMSYQANAGWEIKNTPNGTFKINTETGEAIRYICYKRITDMSTINYGDCQKSGWENEYKEWFEKNVFQKEIIPAMRAAGIKARKIRANSKKALEAPSKGDLVDGYYFKGGDPSDKNNWVKENKKE